MSGTRVSHIGISHRVLARSTFAMGAAFHDLGGAGAEAVVVIVDGDAHFELEWVIGFCLSEVSFCF